MVLSYQGGRCRGVAPPRHLFLISGSEQVARSHSIYEFLFVHCGVFAECVEVDGDHGRIAAVIYH